MLKCDLTDFAIAEDLLVRRMDDELKERLFKVKNIDYGHNGLIRRCTYSQFSEQYEEGHLFMAWLHLKSNNYVLITSDPERANKLNLALKLLGDSSTSLFTGFGASGSRHYISQCFYNFKLPALTLTQKEVILLESLVSQIHDSCDDDRFQIMSDIYIHAMSDKIRPGSRFIKLTIILEILLLPIQESELS